MKLAIASLVAALTLPLAIGMGSRAAHADKAFTKGKGASWDCNKDPVVLINHGRGNYKLTGKCKSVNINGADNTLDIEAVDTLNVSGALNKISVGTLDEVVMSGSGNKITYKAAKGDKVKSQVSGISNSIEAAK
jgi:hypothetical protein